MISRKLEPSPPIRIGDWVLVPVERTTLNAGTSPGGFVYLGATKTLHALVLVGNGRRRAFDANGDPTPVSTLLTDVPDLRHALKD